MGRTLSGALDRDEWPARTSYFCNMCPHRDVCPAHAGPVLAAGEAAATLAGAAAAGIAR